jgi:hypothetical protein
MKIHPSVQKLLVGGTHREAGDLISLLSFLENRLKIQHIAITADVGLASVVLYAFLKHA